MNDKNIIHCVSISGGKDSQATAHLAFETVPREQIRLVTADTGNEDERTYRHIDYLERFFDMPIVRLRTDFSENIAHQRTIVETKWRTDGIPEERIQTVLQGMVPSGNPFLDLCIWKGRFPARRAQFCTDFLKTRPLTEYHTGLIDAGYAVYSWQGVRMDESYSRKQRFQGSGACVKGTFEAVGGGLYNYRPILRWNVNDVLEACRAAGAELNPLYTLGMNRVGCMPCVNAAKPEILEISKRFPHHIERIAMWEGIVAAVAKCAGASFFPDPDRQAHLNKRGIWNMVQWSRTSRGGRNIDAFADEEPAACSSSYGLCE